MSFWSDKVHAYLDNKFFPVYLNRRGRDYAAKRAARGTFRSKGQGLAKGACEAAEESEIQHRRKEHPCLRRHFREPSFAVARDQRPLERG